MLDSVRQNDSIATRVTWIALCTCTVQLARVLCSYIHVHVIKDYALHAMMQQCIKFIAAREGSPHNVLHSSSILPSRDWKRGQLLPTTLVGCRGGTTS